MQYVTICYTNIYKGELLCQLFIVRAVFGYIKGVVYTIADVKSAIYTTNQYHQSGLNHAVTTKKSKNTNAAFYNVERISL